MAKSKKVSKWDAAPESIKKLKEAINGTVDGLSIAGGLDDPNEWEQELIDILEKVLYDYNELEAKHNSDCGLISILEADNDDLECELGKYKTIIKDLRHENEELETELNEKKNVINEVEGKFKTLMDYLRDEWRFEVDYRPDIGTHNWHWHLRQVGPNQYNHNSNNFRYAFKEACRYIGMTPGQIADEVRWVRLSDTTECDIINRWKRMSEQAKPFRDELEEKCNNLIEEIDDKNKIIEELIDENRVLQLKNLANETYGLTSQIGLLNKEIEDLKSENREWQIKCNNLMKENEKLLARNRKLTTGYNILYRDMFSSHYGLGDCHNCKNFDPKE